MKWGTLSTPIKVASAAFIAAGLLHLILNLIEGDYPPAAIIFEGALVLFGLLVMTQRRWVVGLVTVVGLAFAIVTILSLPEQSGRDLAAATAFALLLIVASVSGGFALIKTKPETGPT